MKTIIAGSRDISYECFIACLIRLLPYLTDEITEVVSGEARGVDTFGKEWGRSNGIRVEPFPANWDKYRGAKPNPAGFIRNEEMAKYADCLIAIWNGESGGTADMIDRAKRHGLDIYLATVNTETKLIKTDVFRNRGMVSEND